MKNIDGNNFSSNKFFEEFLRTHTFTQVRQEDSKLKQGTSVNPNHSSNWTLEIRLLDSEMKTLVYENYEKFIGAAETIRSVRNPFANSQ